MELKIINALSSLATSLKGGFFLDQWQTSGTEATDTKESINPYDREFDHKYLQCLVYFAIAKERKYMILKLFYFWEI